MGITLPGYVSPYPVPIFHPGRFSPVNDERVETNLIGVYVPHERDPVPAFSSAMFPQSYPQNDGTVIVDYHHYDSYFEEPYYPGASVTFTDLEFDLPLRSLGLPGISNYAIVVEFCTETGLERDRPSGDPAGPFTTMWAMGDYFGAFETPGRWIWVGTPSPSGPAAAIYSGAKGFGPADWGALPYHFRQELGVEQPDWSPALTVPGLQRSMYVKYNYLGPTTVEEAHVYAVLGTSYWYGWWYSIPGQVNPFPVPPTPAPTGFFRIWETFNLPSWPALSSAPADSLDAGPGYSGSMRLGQSFKSGSPGRGGDVPPAPDEVFEPPPIGPIN